MRVWVYLLISLSAVASRSISLFCRVREAKWREAEIRSRGVAQTPRRRSAGTRSGKYSLYSSRERSLVSKIKALRLYNPGIQGDFSLSYAPFEKARKIKMLEASLSQLEQLVSDLVQQNQNLTAELAQAKDENESLQLSLMEHEEKQGATAARIQALVERVSAGPVSA